MAIQTNVVWETTLTGEANDVVWNYLLAANLAGNTDLLLVTNSEENTALREWNTVESAEAYVAFVKALAIPPVSAEVIQS